MERIDFAKITIEEIEKHNPPLLEAIKDLKDAANAYKKMASIRVGSFLEYDRAWRDFLQSIDRVWNKTVDRCRHEKKWQKFKSKYENLRKKDPLLRYITQARNVTEHSISQVVKEWDANLRVKNVGKGMELQFDPWDRPLLPVNNRGTIFNPPKKHLEKPMSHYKKIGVEEPLLVADLAMQFYINMINELSQELFHQNFNS